MHTSLQLVSDSTIKTSSYQEVMTPLIQNVKEVVKNGITYRNKVYPVRLAALQGDGLERASMSGMCSTFTTVSHFDPLSYVTTKTRTNCKKVAALVTEVDQRRTRDSYEDDVLRMGKRQRLEATMKSKGTWEKDKGTLLSEFEYSRGLKFASPWHEVPNYHVVDRGSLVYCISHDLYAGIFRTDMARVMVDLSNEGFYTWPDLQSKFRTKRNELTGDDRQGWYDIIPPKNKFLKLPGNHGCNHLIIRFFATLFVNHPPDDKMFKTTAWKMYLQMKRISELVSAKVLSRQNKEELGRKIKEYLQVINMYKNVYSFGFILSIFLLFNNSSKR